MTLQTVCEINYSMPNTWHLFTSQRTEKLSGTSTAPQKLIIINNNHLHIKCLMTKLGTIKNLSKPLWHCTYKKHVAETQQHPICNVLILTNEHFHKYEHLWWGRGEHKNLVGQYLLKAKQLNTPQQMEFKYFRKYGTVHSNTEGNYTVLALQK